MIEERKLTKEFLKKLLRKDFKLYYTTPELNDCLYLHYKGFDKIENLEEFTGLKVIYLEGNGLVEISGLNSLTNLRCLYLQENLIKQIQNLDCLTELINLNLSDNILKKVEKYFFYHLHSLGRCTKLQTLQVKRNRIGLDGLSDLEGLLQLPQLSVLDISDNKIADPAVIDEIFAKMPCLSVLYFQNNPACKEIQNYRKTIIHKLPKLKFLDDRPVFDDERRFAEAFAKGGLALEREERQKYKKEQEEEQLRQHQAFRNMIARARDERLQQQQQELDEQAAGSQVQTETDPSNLSTYNTPSQNITEQSEHSNDQQSLDQESEKSKLSRQQSDRSIQSQKSEKVEINAVGIEFDQKCQLDELD